VCNLKGIALSSTHKLKISNAKMGKKRSQESINKQIESLTGKKRPDHSLRLLGVARPKIACPHCGKEGGINNMPRWHFNNCQQNNLTAIMAQGD
jgi:hypothetical protein